jgi:hypothetical protein
MRRITRLRVSPGLVLAAIALLVALGGTSYAAVGLARNSVGTAQLKNNAVTSAKVKNHSLLRADFKAGQVPAGRAGPAGAAGPAGPTGPAGPAGPAGAAGKWALVDKTGNISAQSGGITLVPASGGGTFYLNFGAAVTGKNIQVTGALTTSDGGGRGTPIAGICGGGGGEQITCLGTNTNNTSTVEVVTYNEANALPAAHSFYIAVF